MRRGRPVVWGEGPAGRRRVPRVSIPPGRHTVAFSYRNPEEMRGRLVAGAGLVVLAALLAAGGRIGAPRQPKRARERLNR